MAGFTPIMSAPDVPSVVLTGDAATGLIVDETHRRAVAGLPVEVKLGRRSPVARPQCFRLEAYSDWLASVPVPESADWYTKAAASVARMYDNDRLGCCVFSGKHHQFGIWSANDPDSFNGKTVLATDAEVQSEYFAYTGGADNGAVISEVLDIMRTRGLVAGGMPYKIRGYVSADPRDKDMVKAGVYLFGGGTIGINLPSAWTSSAVWDVTNTRSVGGHDVTLGGYGRQQVIATTQEGVIILSWGRLYLITWPAFTDGKHVDEMYFSVPEKLWVGDDGVAPNGINLSVLLDDMAKIGGGTIPPLPDPTPTPPPVPPTPAPPPGPTPTPPTPVHVTFTGTGQQAPYTFTIPASGLFGHPTSVTIPGQTIPVSGSGSLAGAGGLLRSVFGFTWADLWGIVRQGGPIGVDILNVFVAWKTHDRQAVIDALEKLAADLGIPLPTVR